MADEPRLSGNDEAVLRELSSVHDTRAQLKEAQATRLAAMFQPGSSASE